MASPHPTTAPEFTTYRLRSWNELYAVQAKRYFHAADGAAMRIVEISRDLRIACRCGQFGKNLQTGAGPCSHVAEALDFIDAVGYNRLPTWAAKS